MTVIRDEEEWQRNGEKQRDSESVIIICLLQVSCFPDLIQQDKSSFIQHNYISTEQDITTNVSDVLESYQSFSNTSALCIMTLVICLLL